MMLLTIVIVVGIYSGGGGGGGGGGAIHIKEFLISAVLKCLFGNIAIIHIHSKSLIKRSIISLPVLVPPGYH